MDSSDVGGNDRGLRASFLRTFFAIALEQNFGETKRSGSYDVASHDPPGGAKWREMWCARVCACSAARSEHIPLRGKQTSASEMAQRGTKRVRTTMAAEEEGQYSSPTKRIRSKPTREEEEEEEDDEFDTSGSQDVDASQLCTQGEMIAMRNSELVVSTDCGSSL